jgi:hypothetical protein
MKKLINLAIKIYTKNSCKAIADKFIEDTTKYPVADKRKEGFYCTECSRFEKEARAYIDREKVIYHWSKTGLHKIEAIWIVKGHYCGCQGWN